MRYDQVSKVVSGAVKWAIAAALVGGVGGLACSSSTPPSEKVASRPAPTLRRANTATTQTTTPRVVAQTAPLRETPASVATESPGHPTGPAVASRTDNATGGQLAAKGAMNPAQLRLEMARRASQRAQGGIRNAGIATAPPATTQQARTMAAAQRARMALGRTTTTPEAPGPIPAPVGLLESNKGLWSGRIALSGGAPRALHQGPLQSAGLQTRQIAAPPPPTQMRRDNPAQPSLRPSGAATPDTSAMRQEQAPATTTSGQSAGAQAVQLRARGGVAAAVPQGYEGRSLAPEGVPIQEPFFTLTADALAADYAQLDSLALVRKYRGSTIEIRGRVGRLLNLGDEQGTEIWLQTERPVHVAARFSDRGLAVHQARVARGTEVVVQCHPGGTRNGNITLGDCKLVGE